MICLKLERSEALGVRNLLMRFGDFEVDPASGELRKLGVKIKLQEQPFQALVALIERPGEVQTREELQKRLWNDGTAVDFERGLNKAINRVREALGDDAENPRFIETLPQRGYRFLAEVEMVPAETPEAVALPSIRPPMQRRSLLAIGGGLAAVPLIGVGYFLTRGGSRRIRSIAVLPLENLSGNPEQEYFADGLTDELIGEIARIGSLRVISRTSIVGYKKGSARKSLPEIARELDVDAILEGTVMQVGKKVRITAQLIRAYDDRHLWAEKYERDLSDILALQGDVARVIAGQIQITLTPEEKRGLGRIRQVHPAAYEAFLKGNFFLHRGMPGIARSIEFFGQAIRHDPAFAGAYAGLAEALCFAGIFGLRPSSETYPEAKAAALKALELDELNGGAHNALANVKDGYDWDLAGAEASYRRALQLSPSSLLTRLWYAEHLTRMGRFDAAVAESGRAIALDPVSPMSYGVRSMIFFRARRFDEAIGAGQQALEFDQSFVNALWWQGLSYAGNRDFTKSIACLKRAIAMSDGPLYRALLGFVYGRAGERDKALSVLGELTKMAKERFVPPVDFAIVHAGLCDVEATFFWLEKAYEARATRILELRSMYFDCIRADARYADLMRRIGLPLEPLLRG